MAKKLTMKKSIILLIEDDELDVISVKRSLNKIGIEHELVTAYNGVEAFDKLKGNDHYPPMEPLPDVILLDLNMPIMDGFTFLEAFRKLNLPDKEKVTIIVVTSSEDPDDIMKARRMGVDHYIPKPVTEKDLRQALEMN